MKENMMVGNQGTRKEIIMNGVGGVPTTDLLLFGVFKQSVYKHLVTFNLPKNRKMKSIFRKESYFIKKTETLTS